MGNQMEKLIQDLEQFQTRATAIRGLIRIGGEAVPPLIKALNSPFPPVRWSAVKLLGQIGNEEALQALLPLEKDPELGATAAEAIVRLKERLNRQAAPGETEVDDQRTIESHEESFMEKVIEGTQIKMTNEGNRFLLRVPTTAARAQNVSVYFGARDKDGTGFIAVYTQCGKASPKYYEWALRQNAKLPLGGIALRNIHGEPWFVMINKHLARTADVDELRETVLELARKADAMEKALTGTDVC